MLSKVQGKCNSLNTKCITVLQAIPMQVIFCKIFFFKKYFADLWTEENLFVKSYIQFIYIFIQVYLLPISSFTAPFWPFRDVFSYLMHRELTSGICKSGLVFIHVVWSSFRREKTKIQIRPSIFLKSPIYFSLFELKKNVMQLLSKAPKKKKNTTIFFSKTHQNPLLQLLIA